MFFSSPRVLVAVVSSVLLASCSTTILDSINSTTTSSVVTTTTVPVGSVTELLAAMHDATDGLGDMVAQRRGDEARGRLAIVESIWVSLRPQLIALKNDSDVDVERIVNLVRSSVNKKRPADADKASRFLRILLDARG
jgi:hypothetical protein